MDDPPIGSALLEQLTSLVAPPLCPACGSARPAREVLCEGCGSELATAPRVVEPGPPGVDLAVSASPFEGVARRMVHGLKFGRRLALAGVAAEAMLRALTPHESSDPAQKGAEPMLAIVPVPPGPWRWRWRGFDPAEELAIAASRSDGRPFCDCLRRSRGRRQVGRRRADRLSGPPRVWLKGEPPVDALLVDDVWTTGATLSACATVLRSGGSRRIVALTLARAL